MEKKVIDGNKYFNQDCINGAQENLESNSVDLIITDPPYGIEGDTLDNHYNRDENFVVDGYVEIPANEYNDFSHKWVKQAERVLKPGGAIYIVSGYTNLYDVLDALKSTKLEEVNHLIWKYNFGVYTKKKYISSHYHILFYQKPGAERTFNLYSRYGFDEKDEKGGSLNYQDREDVWEINREYKPGENKNKNELPTQLLTKILQYSSNQGDLICDFFMGGFTTPRVAIGLKRNFVGFEISEQIYQNGIKKIREVEPGALLEEVRSPEHNQPRNQGEKWTTAEKEKLIKRYRALCQKYNYKKKVIQQLQKELGRGKFGIKRMIKIIREEQKDKELKIFSND